ncbi:hypothetical protein C1Y63_09890 [Corynebacterium sp. 13CS0277]|uniref:DoxX family protein n=1 Tax=Corynebacterium sp. 13CS0277 TaxID=2071994 RepID=UPI000D02ABE9|nr:DoxX family protein [Corynebacterium sp. 13CS0277]PRQ10759.1 hypothetical protein C1Y63_09890 [Corynebacterium sp. 13CS0277]
MTPHKPKDNRTPAERPVATGDDFVELDTPDVPEVTGSELSSIYARAGRAEPTTIQPKPQADTAGGPADGAPAGEMPEVAPTEIIPSTPHAPVEAPLASDAPTTAFDAPTPGQKRAADVAKLLPPLDDEPQPVAPADAAAPTAVFAPQAPTEDYLDGPGPLLQDPALPAEDAPEAAAVVVESPRRGTIDFGLLLLRLVLGGALGLHAVSVFFGLFGSRGLVSLQNEFAGYDYPSILAVAIPALELTAAVFLILGLMAPIAAAVALVVTSFTLAHQVYNDGTQDGIVLAGVLFGLALGLQFTGPGRIGLDFSRGWARRPLASSWVMLLLAAACVAGLWWVGTGVNPLH